MLNKMQAFNDILLRSWHLIVIIKYDAYFQAVVFYRILTSYIDFRISWTIYIVYIYK